MADNKGLNPFATGVAGAVIGAAAAAAAVALSDEKNRKKAEKILADMEKEGSKVLKEITRIAMSLKEKTAKELPKAQKEVKKVTGRKQK